MALTEKYCNPDLATGANDGSSEANAWQSMSAMASGYAAGDRVNIKRTASRHDPGGVITLSTSAGATTPVHIRGYTTTIGDGGMFEMAQPLIVTAEEVLVEGIDALADYTSYVLRMTGDGSAWFRCRGVNTRSGDRFGIEATDASAIYCDAAAEGTSGSIGIKCDRGHAYGCRSSVTDGTGISVNSAFRANSLIANQIVGDGSAGSVGVYVADLDGDAGTNVSDNIIYDLANGIELNELRDVSDASSTLLARNLIYSVTNGIFNGDSATKQSTVDLIANAIGSATTARYSGFGDLPLPGDITLTADPFTDAAGGDYSLNDTSGGGALLRAAGFAINPAYDWDSMQPLATAAGGGGGSGLLRRIAKIYGAG
jgi:hypothetical protein